jgi:7,8-dihydropterin-6-yl-methyl-4-(beta-D-ribofuranosyl)aminobenzene 5'-phosphate synthase
MGNAGKATLTTVYDNYRHGPRPGLRTGWGFSCLIEMENGTILFDTGGDSETLLGNMEKLGKDPGNIDKVVLSHAHGDHTGGLEGLLNIKPRVTVYLLRSFPQGLKDEVESLGAKVKEVAGPEKVSEGVLTTGELGTWIKEQSLVINSPEGPTVITGCAHPGIVRILGEAGRLVNKEICLAIGGFHLEGETDTELVKIIEAFKELHVKKAAPCHCSGERARELFGREYGNGYVDNGVGKVIEL